MTSMKKRRVKLYKTLSTENFPEGVPSVSKRAVKWIGSVFVLLMMSFMSPAFANNEQPHEIQPGQLSHLELRVTIGGGGELSPAFSPDVTHYTAWVQSDIDNVQVIATAREGAEVTISGAPVNRGFGNVAGYRLEVGMNELIITVHDDGVVGTYTISIEREDIMPVVNKFQHFTYQDPTTGVDMAYSLFVPEDYDPNRSYPLVFFLHGNGERGYNDQAHLIANQGATIWAKPEEQAVRPAFVLAPQAPRENLSPQGENLDGVWTNPIFGDPYTPTKYLITAYNILQKVMEEYNIDEKRIYATGISMGGFGTWAINIHYPDLFAAMVPVVSFGDPVGAAEKLVDKPIWHFAAEADFVIDINAVRAVNQALIDAGGSPRYTEYPASAYIYPMAHFAWVPAYANVEMREWLFEQVKP